MSRRHVEWLGFQIYDQGLSTRFGAKSQVVKIVHLSTRNLRTNKGSMVALKDRPEGMRDPLAILRGVPRVSCVFLSATPRTYQNEIQQDNWKKELFVHPFLTSC